MTAADRLMYVAAMRYRFPAFLRPIMRRRPRLSFAWNLVWYLTWRCNLNCSYCWQHRRAPDDPLLSSLPELHNRDCAENHERALRTVIERQPLSLTVSGGEASLVPELPELLRAVRAGTRAAVQLNSNALGNPQCLLSCLPYLDSLLLSVDVPDANGHIGTRNISVADLLAALREIAAAAAGLSRPVHICCNTVVTRDNYLNLGELAGRLRSIQPAWQWTINPVSPYSSPLSFAESAPAVDLFRDHIAGLRDAVYPNIRCSIPKQRAGLPLRAEQAIRCHRQFFMGFIDPDGSFYTCKNICFNYFDELCSSGRIGSPVAYVAALLRVARMFRQQSTDCYLSCPCAADLEPVLAANSAAEFHALDNVYTRGLSTARLAACLPFVRRFVNSRFYS